MSVPSCTLVSASGDSIESVLRGPDAGDGETR